MKKEVIIIGAGGHGKVIADIVKRSGDTLVGFLDDNELAEGKVIGKIEDCKKYADKLFIVGIGNNKIRENIVLKYPELKYYTAIHPAAVICEECEIGEGTCVMANAVINPSAIIGRHCIINTNATVEHDNDIGDFVHVSPGAILCGTVTVGKRTHIGAGAVVKNNICVAENCRIGIGAAVVKDISEVGTYVGVPARKMME